MLDELDGIPFEVRPVTDPAAARAAAYRSMNASRQARSQPRRKVPTPHPLDCECVGCSYSRSSAQQGQLERRRRARPRKRTDHTARRDLAKARDRRDVREARRIGQAQRAYVSGSDPTPLGKYSQEDVDQLGREAKALAKGDGSHWFPIAKHNDVQNAVAAYRKLKPGERNGVHAWIVERARLLNAEHLLPKGMGEPVQKVIGE
jgi:hypothetical protein